MTLTDTDFTYSLTTRSKATEVFDLLLHIDQWWSGVYGETIKGDSSRLNDEFTFTAGGGMHYSKQQLTELVPGKKIGWEVIDSKLTFLKKTDEWTGTHICFDITTSGDKTKLTFTHKGLVPEIECFDNCSVGWTKYLQQLQGKLK